MLSGTEVLLSRMASPSPCRGPKGRKSADLVPGQLGLYIMKTLIQKGGDGMI